MLEDRARFYEPNKIGFTLFGLLQIFILNLQITLETKLENHLEKGERLAAPKPAQQPNA
jgi:hypothetical protein